MLICFFYRLEGSKTSYEYIKSFIKYLKQFIAKLFIIPNFFPTWVLDIAEKSVLVKGFEPAT